MEVSDLNKLLKMHRQMSDMMKKMGKMGKGKMLKQAMKGMFGKGGPSPEEMAAGMDPKALEQAAKAMGGKMPGGLPGMGGGMGSASGPQRVWKEEVSDILRHHIPRLETERLILRAPSEADLEAEAEFFASTPLEIVGGPLRRDETWRSIAMLLGHWAMRGFGFWGVEEKDTGIYVGRVGLWFPEGWPEPEIGWTLMTAMPPAKAYTRRRGRNWQQAVARPCTYDDAFWGDLGNRDLT